MSLLRRAVRGPPVAAPPRGWLEVRQGLLVGVTLLVLALFARGAPVRHEQLLAYAATLQVPLLRLGLTPGLYAAYITTLDIVIVTAHGGIALLLLWRRPGERMALLVSLALVTVPLTVTHALQPAAPARLLVALVESLALVSSVALLYLFPDGRFVPGWTRIPAGLWTGVVLATLFLPAAPLSPARWPAPLLAATLLALVGSGLFAQWRRYRTTGDPARREQSRWAALGLAAAALAPVGFFFPFITLPSLDRSPLPTLFYQIAGPDIFTALLLLRLVGFTLYTLALLLFPLCFLIAIRRYRLWEIDRLLHRTLLYGTLTATVVLLYILVVGALAALLQSRGTLLPAALATGLVALGVHPLRLRLQRAVNRLIYGERDDPVTILERLGRRLEAPLEPEAALQTIVETVAHALRLPYVAIALSVERGSDAPGRVAAVGTPGRERPTTFPLLFQGEWVGEMQVAARDADSALSAADRRLLGQIAYQAGATAHSARLARALRRSRETLVAAREEERHRLRRTLHDDVGPTLAGLSLRADAARNLLATDPDGVARLLVEIRSQAQQTLRDVRRLAYDLRPPALDQLGLLPAIQERAAAHSAGGLAVEVQAPDPLPPLPAAVEVAAYHVVIEAITNVERHAAAHHCMVTLAVDGHLAIRVRDDGVGLPHPHRSGLGLGSIRERAEELGGTFRIGAGDGGGTELQVHLPLGRGPTGKG